MGDGIVSGEETRHLQALHSLKVLDVRPEARFERVTHMARRLFDVPIAVVRLDDRPRGECEHAEAIELFETGRIVETLDGRGDDVLIVPDAFADDRFGYPPVVQDGRRARFYAGCAIRSTEGRQVGTLCMIDTAPHRLAAEDVALFRELGNMVGDVFSSLSMATSDPLTRLANRRGFEDIAAHILPMAIRLRIPLSLVQIDLDDFKAINDRHGHEAGDRTLASFARHLLKNFRESDVVARLGGDEFGVLMSGASEPNVARCLERLEGCLGSGPEPPIRFSAGVATLDPRRHTRIGDLLRDADRRMYESKRRKQRALQAS